MNASRAALLLVITPALLGLSAMATSAACPQRLGIGYGDSLESIAHGCGITVERLRSVNPGLNSTNLQAGTFVTIPRPALPSPQLPYGRQSIRIAPSLVPPATGISPSQTVIAPPPPPVVRHFEIPGLAEQPERFSIRPRPLMPGLNK